MTPPRPDAEPARRDAAARGGHSALGRFLAGRPGSVRPGRFWLLSIAALAAALVFLRLSGSGAFATAEGVALDLRFDLRGTLPAPQEVVIVAIDDRTIANLRRFPLPRSALALMVERLRAAGAKVIAFDLLLSDFESPSDGIRLSPGDQALFESLQRADNVVLGAAGVFRIDGRASPETREAAARAALPLDRIAGDRQALLERLPVARDLLTPAPPLVGVAALGHVNVPVDPGGALRRLPMAIRFEDTVVAGFPLVVTQRFVGAGLRDLTIDADGLGLPGGRRVATDAGLMLALNYYGGRGHFATVSAIDLLDGKVPAERLRGKIALVGAAALGVGDSFVAPFSQELPGVEALATAIGNMLNGDALVRDDRTLMLDLLLIVLLCFLGWVGAGTSSLPFAGALTVAIWLVWLVLLQKSFEAGLWLDAAAPTFALLAAGLLSLTGRVQAQRRLSGRLADERENLARYQSPIMAESLARQEHPAFEGRPQNAGILFVDIAAFTGRSERIGPQGTVDFLRDFHGRLEAVVLAHGGVIEHFMGDGAMVIFGIPEQREDDAARTLACAHALLEDAAEWNVELHQAGNDPVRIGVGVHYGPVVMATLGGRQQRHVTAAGDTVNVASRLQSLTRNYPDPIAASDELVRAVRTIGREDLVAPLEPQPPQPIRGRDTPMVVWTGGRAAVAP